MWGEYIVAEEGRMERELECAVDIVEYKEGGGTGECRLICQQEAWIGEDGEGWLSEYRC